MDPRRALVAFTFVGLAAAQTFVVDAAGGPGSSFTSIDAATAAVPDGAVLLVRPGTYAGFTIANKGLSVLGEPGVLIEQPAIVVQNTLPTQRTSLSSLTIGGTQRRIECTACAGLVLLDRIQPQPTGGPFPPPLRLVLNQCTHVLATACRFNSEGFQYGVSSTSSRLVMVECNGVGTVASAVNATGSDMQLVSCSLSSGGSSGSTAVFAQSTNLRLLGTTSLWSPGPCIAGYPSVRIAPGVTLSNTPQTSSLTPIDDERVTGTGGALGGSVSATMNGANGSLAAMFLGVTSPPLLVPGIADAWWLDPGISASVAVAFLTAPVTATVTIPPTPALQGSVWGFQTFYLKPSGFSASNPFHFVIS